MPVKAIGATALTGGGTGALDSRSGSLLTDGDVAFVETSDYVYIYVLDADSGLPEDPPRVIAPDANPGTKRWILIGSSVPQGVNTGDIIRYNAATGNWESCVEPFEFTQIVLTPRATPVSDVEGGLFYKSTDNGVYVGTE